MPRPKILLAVLLVTAVALGAIVWGALQGPVANVRESGEAKVGGPFELVDETGATVTEADFAGKLKLVYFGFTFCPDVCPTELAKIAIALEELGPLADEVTPIFITVDPERDDVEAVAAYTDHFWPTMVGLTGSPEQIDAAAKAYRVYYRKVEDPGSSADYTMDHSSIIYLMGPDGRFIDFFSANATPEDIEDGIRKAL